MRAHTIQSTQDSARHREFTQPACKSLPSVFHVPGLVLGAEGAAGNKPHWSSRPKGEDKYVMAQRQGLERKPLLRGWSGKAALRRWHVSRDLEDTPGTWDIPSAKNRDLAVK